MLPQTSPCRYPRCCGRHLGVTSHTVLVSPPSPPGCCRRHGGNITSGAASDMAAASPQVLPQTWRQHHLSQPFSSALPGPVSPGKTGTNHLHPPGSLQPASPFGGSGGGSPGPRPHRPWVLTPPVGGQALCRRSLAPAAALDPERRRAVLRRGTWQTLPSAYKGKAEHRAAPRRSARRPHLADAPRAVPPPSFCAGSGRRSLTPPSGGRGSPR